MSHNKHEVVSDDHLHSKHKGLLDGIMKKANKGHAHVKEARDELEKLVSFYCANIKNRKANKLQTLKERMLGALGELDDKLLEIEKRQEKAKKMAHHSHKVMEAKTIFNHKVTEIRAILTDFKKALEPHKHHKSVKVLIEHLGHETDEFRRLGDLKMYKTNCMKLLKDHRDKHHKMHHREPKGVFEHIANVVRAMLRLLEKMSNYIFGTKSSMFKKPESELGKLMKEYHHKIDGLMEFQEEKMTHQPAKLKK